MGAAADQEEAEAAQVEDESDDDDDDEEHEEGEETASSDEDEDFYEHHEPLRNHPHFEDLFSSLESMGLGRVENEKLQQRALKAMGGSHRDFRLVGAVYAIFKLMRADGTVSAQTAAGRVAEVWYGKAKGKRSYRCSKLVRVARFMLEAWAPASADGKTPARIKVPPTRKGEHSKVQSLLDNDDVVEEMSAWLRGRLSTTKDANSFKIEDLASFVREQWVVEVHVATLYRWMHRLNFQQKEPGSGLYFDRHEDGDVVAYRDAFCGRFFDYEKCLPEIMEVENKFSLVWSVEEADRLVMVTHDESTTAYKDGKRRIWAHKENSPARFKSTGCCIMSSAFACACHGAFSTRKIEPGKGKDDYWTCDDLVGQFGEAIVEFRRLHPGMTGLWMFDNSANHHKKFPGGLDASKLNVADGGANLVPFVKKGYFYLDVPAVSESGPKRIKLIQTMVNDDGSQKGLRSLLFERGLIDETNRLVGGPPDQGPLLKDGMADLLAKQPDFAEQLEWLQQIVKENGQLIDYYPKYHCELNWIERRWGWMKRYTREHCDFTLAGMRRIIAEAEAELPPEFNYKWERAARRYIDAYRPRPGVTTLTFAQVQWATKKYTSHRVVPESLFARIDDEMANGS